LSFLGVRLLHDDIILGRVLRGISPDIQMQSYLPTRHNYQYSTYLIV